LPADVRALVKALLEAAASIESQRQRHEAGCAF
jgi:hypothetical protein